MCGVIAACLVGLCLNEVSLLSEPPHCLECFHLTSPFRYLS
jgi:hypothetical protein